MLQYSSIFYMVFLLFSLSFSVYALPTTTNLIGAKSLYSFGINTSEKSVCIIDTGVDYTHPSFGGCTTNDFLNGNCQKVISGYDFGDNDLDPFPQTGPQRGHATQIAGITSLHDNTIRGVAPDSKIIAIKVFDDAQNIANNQLFSVLFANVKKGIQWCVDNVTKYNISAISISLADPSLGFSLQEGCADTHNLQTVINDAVAKNIAVVAASGNNGNINGIAYPTCLYNITSVGSVSNNDIVNNYVSRGSNLDILAPGGYLKTTKVGGGFTAGSSLCTFLFTLPIPCTIGTSYAAPHVAGSILLIKQIDSALPLNTIERRLKGTGKEVYDFRSGLTFSRIDLLSFFDVLSWSTFHHDNRRTGFTLLKGDMVIVNRIDKLNLVLDSNVVQDHIARASVADIDIDSNKDQDVIIASSKLGSGTHDGVIFDSELRRIKYTHFGGNVSIRLGIRKKWQYDVGYEVEAPPSLGNIDADKQREIVFGLDNGTLIALDPSGSSASFKWSFTVPRRYSPAAQGYFHGDLAFTALEDIDNDGTTEILFVEGEGTLPDFPGNIYILRDNGNSATWESNYTLGEGGGRGAPSIANIDSDDKPEIIVPTFYGVRVFDYDGSTLTPVTWSLSNTDGKINGAIAVADVDKDNQYEIIYTTHTATCHASKTCYNRLYIRDALTGANEGGSPISLSAVSRVTPAIGDVDNDGNVEIVLNLEESGGKIACYEINGNNCTGSWPYSAPTIDQNTPSPDIADIDGDGKYDILFTRSNSKMISILNGDATLKYNFSVEGTIGSAPAIADVDDDGVAEIAVKRAGSPITIFTAITDLNQQPQFNVTGNVTMAGIAGNTLDINIHDNLTGNDPDNDNLNIIYNSPYNTSGQWETTINDTGDYVSYAELTDGNLSSVIEINTKIFDNVTTQVVTTFTDGDSAKALSFSGAENKTLQIQLPKNATIAYSRIKVGGRT